MKLNDVLKGRSRSRAQELASQAQATGKCEISSRKIFLVENSGFRNGIARHVGRVALSGVALCDRPRRYSKAEKNRNNGWQEFDHQWVLPFSEERVRGVQAVNMWSTVVRCQRTLEYFIRINFGNGCFERTNMIGMKSSIYVSHWASQRNQ